MKYKLKLNDDLRFGKHKGKTVIWVAENDRQYLFWLAEHDIKSFDDEVASYVVANPPKKRKSVFGGMDADWAAEVGCDHGMDVWGH